MKSIVRSSKYRHVHGDPNKPDKSFQAVRAVVPGDGNGIKANNKFFACAYEGGGGPLLIHPVKKYLRFGAQVPTLNVHSAKVYDFAFSPFLDNLIATGAEDGYVKVTLFPEDGVTSNIDQASAELQGHSKKVAYVQWHPTANQVLASCAYDTTVKVWDVEKSACVLNYEDPTDVVQSLEWNQNGSLLATTCKDKKNRVFDPRQAAAANVFPQVLTPGKGSRCAWYDKVGKLVTVGFTDSGRGLAVWDVKNLKEPLQLVDVDQGSSILIPYMDVDTGMLYLAGRGDVSIRYFEINDEGPYAHGLSLFQDKEAQRGIAFLPKKSVDVAGCEVAVCLRMLKDSVQPVSFVVPRKSDLFQSDIYPDTNACRCLMGPAEYFGGANKEPVFVSMNPKDSQGANNGASQGAAFKVQKTAQQLQVELDAANAKIAKLEAELAALKAH